MAHARVQAPDRDLVGDGDRVLKLGRLAQQRQQAVGLAADGRHLIHHAARRAGHQVLHLLAQQRHLPRLDFDSERDGHRLHHRHFERRRGTHALALGHIGRNEDARAFGEPRAALAHQRQECAGGVRRPVLGRVACKVSPRAVVVERFQLRQRHLESPWTLEADDAQPARPIARDRGQRGLTQRQLQHQRAGVVGDATHQVQPAGRARHEQSVNAVEQRPRLRGGVQRAREGLQVTHASSPRFLRAACSSGSTSSRMCWLA